MRANRKDLVQNLLKMTNLLLIAAIFEMVWLTFYQPRAQMTSNQYTGILLYVLFCIVYLMYTKIYDGFLILSSRVYELICGQVLSAIIADVLMFLIIWLVSGPFPNPLPLMGALVLQVSLSILWSVTAHRWYFANHSPQQAIMVCEDNEMVDELRHEYGFMKQFEIKAILSPDALEAEDYAQLDHANAVFIASSRSPVRKDVLAMCIKKHKNVYLMPEPEDILFHGAKQVHMFHSAMLRVTRNEPKLGYVIVKRCFDIVFSLVMLLVLSPLLAAVSAAIYLEDGGPVFYRQKRLTINGRAFDILKFRSMHVHAEKDGVARLSTGANDARVTRVGRWIRQLRIDELPQLINVLMGDMSIVGPRPERPELTEVYKREIPQFEQRLRVKAGLTGYAQVYGKYNTTPRNKLIMDMVYIEHRSLWEDLQIIFATAKVLLTPEATEGVAEGQTTALKGKETNT